MPLPVLDPDQQSQSELTTRLILEQIREADGRIGFDRFMELALYAPGAGYYVNGSLKLGAAGDFVTAPQVSPLFSYCLANQCIQLMDRLGRGQILEFGAGSGEMAAAILEHLQRQDCLPDRYLILEPSPDLQQRQQQHLAERLPGLVSRLEWLDRLPGPAWRGVIVANEVLDAMPVHRFRVTQQGLQEQFVVESGGRLELSWQPAEAPALAPAVALLEQRLGRFEPGFSSEINLRLPGWIGAVSEFLEQGALLLIDYGYSEREYYHPQRNDGTLICHFQHRAHADPLLNPGLQDITANVDFSALAQAVVDAGLELAGYTTQANFLIDNGLQQMLLPADAGRPFIDQVQQVKQLTLPNTMGERFKVLAAVRGLDIRLQGFVSGDLRGYL